MNVARPHRLIALAIFVTALCLSVAPLCFDSADCLHGCTHGTGTVGTHSANVGIMGLIVLGVHAIASAILRPERPARTDRVGSEPESDTLGTRGLMVVPLRI